MLCILQWNCQSLRNKSAEIEFRSLNYDIILLSETWLKFNHRINLKNFDCIRSDRLIGEGGGVAIFIRNSIKYSKVTVSESCPGGLEVCAIEIKWQDKPLTIFSTYKYPQLNISSAEWSNFFGSLEGNFILAGDFNSHHTSWGNTCSCAHGNRLFKSITRNNMIILNDGHSTYRPHWRTSETAIDLTIINPNIVANTEWRVEQDNWGSDHAPITVTLHSPVAHSARFRGIQRHHSAKSDWRVIHKNLSSQEQLIKEVLDNPHVDIQVKYTTP